MRQFLLAFFLLWPSAAFAKDLNVEFKFTPFLGEPATADSVESMPGKAAVYINNALINEQSITKQKLPVLFEEREIAPSVWLPVESLGGVLRKGKNTIRIEFSPTDPKKPYQARLSWATVTDQVVTNDQNPGSSTTTNQSAAGIDNRQSTGKVIFEREFNADFAQDLAWHHYPPVTTLSEADKQRLIALVNTRATAFKPNFSGVYQLLKGKPNIRLAEVQKSKCLEKAYAGGMRVTAPTLDQFEFVTPGTPEVFVRSKQGNLYAMSQPKKLSEDNLMCAEIVFAIVFQNSFAMVRTPEGEWKVAY
jgi:hypothetical protein